MKNEDERFLFMTKKKWEGWGAKPYEAAERTLFRWGVIVRINFWTFRRKWVNLQNANGVGRAGWIDSDGTKPDAFADDEKFFVWWRSVDGINCKMII